LLIDNPALNVQMGSHTDCRGDDQYNVDLSLRRAQAAVDYLASRGVKLKRLSAKGYGETERVSDCFCENCTEEEFQKDRRTTFMILE
jgi:outer membrane protein OmpA-like peptidoglycan-associated protein